MKHDLPRDPAEARVSGYDWSALAADLDASGTAVLEHLLTPEECAALAGLYPDGATFAATC